MGLSSPCLEAVDGHEWTDLSPIGCTRKHVSTYEHSRNAVRMCRDWFGAGADDTIIRADPFLAWCRGGSSIVR